MIHAGHTLKTLREKRGVSARDLPGISHSAIYAAEADPLCSMRSDNLERVLGKLGETPTGFLRRVGVGWDGSSEADMRLKIAELLDQLDFDRLVKVLHDVKALVPEPAVAGTVKPPPVSARRRASMTDPKPKH